MDMGDIFGDIFGDFWRRHAKEERANGPMKGQNLRYSVNISLRKPAFGVDKELNIPLKDECTSCHGTGAKEVRQLARLVLSVGGKGQVVFTQQSSFVWHGQKCPDLSGLSWYR